MAGLLKFLTKALLAAKPAPVKKQARKPVPTTPPKSIITHSNDPLGALRANMDIMSGLQFCATMQPWIPLRVLTRHGEIFNAPRGSPPKITRAMNEGIWVPYMHGSPFPLGSMASSVGYIPADGGEFLIFLLAVRRIVEVDESVENRIRALSAELSRPQ